MSQVKPSGVLTAYEHAVTARNLTPDAGQRRIAEAFDRLLAALNDTRRHEKKPFFLRILKPELPARQGIYLWGDVGRGKSMLMHLFVLEAEKHCKTRRVHFHAFMLDVHKRMFTYRTKEAGEVMRHVVVELAQECKVLCLDEFQVTDVADAMILSRLFSGLMDAGVIVVFTSNRPPYALYQGGLQRDQFLAFVALLKERVAIESLNGPEDYRLSQHRALNSRYVYPRDGASDDFLLRCWRTLTDDATSETLALSNEGRIIRVEKHAHGVAWFTFAELCNRPLGATDYLMIAKLFHTVILQSVPKLAPEDRNEAKRLVTLIDALYDHQVKLIITAETAPDGIYAHGDGNFEFHRTVSRLYEMQSENYLTLAHVA